METLVIRTQNKESAKLITKVVEALDGKVEKFQSIEELEDILFGEMMEAAAHKSKRLTTAEKTKLFEDFSK